MKTHKRSYVTFFSPGTLFAETSTKPIGSWDAKVAIGMAEAVVERHGARPYGFRFCDKLEHEPIPDGHGGQFTVEPKQIAESGMFYINGVVKTYDEVSESERVCRSNMRGNGYPHVVEMRNGYLSTREFGEEDVTVTPFLEHLRAVRRDLRILAALHRGTR